MGDTWSLTWGYQLSIPTATSHQHLRAFPPGLLQSPSHWSPYLFSFFNHNLTRQLWSCTQHTDWLPTAYTLSANTSPVLKVPMDWFNFVFHGFPLLMQFSSTMDDPYSLTGLPQFPQGHCPHSFSIFLLSLNLFQSRACLPFCLTRQILLTFQNSSQCHFFPEVFHNVGLL